MSEHQTQERSKSTLEVLLDHERVLAFIVLGLIALAAVIFQHDEKALNSILGGCVSLAVVAAFFLD